VVLLLAQTTLVPPRPLPIHRLDTQIVLLGLLDQNLRLPRQTRYVRDAQFWRRNAVTISTTASSHETFSRARMHGLETDVAFLPLRVVRTRLDRDRDGLLVFVVGVILFRVAAAVNLLADLLVAAAPVVMLAGRVAISRFAPHASRGVVGQRRGAGGAICQDHCLASVFGETSKGRACVCGFLTMYGFYCQA
jgi:hypothetical protein